MSHEIELTDCGGAINCGILLRDKFQRCQLMAKVAQIYLRIRGWRIFAPGLASQHCPTGPSAPFGGACAPQIGATGGSAPRTPKFSGKSAPYGGFYKPRGISTRALYV